MERANPRWCLPGRQGKSLERPPAPRWQGRGRRSGLLCWRKRSRRFLLVQTLPLRRCVVDSEDEARDGDRMTEKGKSELR